MIKNLRKLLQLFCPEQKRTAIVLFGFMLIGMLLETLGISMIIPALALMTQPDLVSKYPVIQPFLNQIGNPNQHELIIYGMCSLAIVYTIKVVFLTYFTWKQTSFSLDLQVSLSQRLFKGYMSLPYTFHLQRNSAELIRNILAETSLFTNAVTSTLVILTEGLVFIGICTLLIVVEPAGAMVVVSIIGISGWFFHTITKNKILKWGEYRQKHEGQRILHLQQGLGGVKEAKLLGREDEFLYKFQLHNEKAAEANKLVTTFRALPRYWLELLAVFGLVSFVLLGLYQGREMASLLPTLGLFVAAAFRVIPLVNRILSGFQAVRYALPAINTLYDEVNSFKLTHNEKVGSSLNFDDSIIIDNVSFTYPAADTASLSGVNLEIKKGTTVGLVGTTGAGKSTLIDIILGLLFADTGSVKVNKKDIRNHLRQWQNKIGYVPQNIFLTDDSLRRNIAFGLPDNQIDDDAVWSAIKSARLEDYVKSLNLNLDTVVGERGVRISGGQRQRIGIARALYHNPEVLVMDEATSSLDINTESEVMDAVHALHGDKTIIIITHRLSTVEECDHVYQIEYGKIVIKNAASAI